MSVFDRLAHKLPHSPYTPRSSPDTSPDASPASGPDVRSAQLDPATLPQFLKDPRLDFCDRIENENKPALAAMPSTVAAIMPLAQQIAQMQQLGLPEDNSKLVAVVQGHIRCIEDLLVSQCDDDTFFQKAHSVFKEGSQKAEALWRLSVQNALNTGNKATVNCYVIDNLQLVNELNLALLKLRCEIQRYTYQKARAHLFEGGAASERAQKAQRCFDEQLKYFGF